MSWYIGDSSLMSWSCTAEFVDVRSDVKMFAFSTLHLGHYGGQVYSHISAKAQPTKDHPVPIAHSITSKWRLSYLL